jgi:hypothetical protein
MKYKDSIRGLWQNVKGLISIIPSKIQPKRVYSKGDKGREKD